MGKITSKKIRKFWGEVNRRAFERAWGETSMRVILIIIAIVFTLVIISGILIGIDVIPLNIFHGFINESIDGFRTALWALLALIVLYILGIYTIPVEMSIEKKNEIKELKSVIKGYKKAIPKLKLFNNDLEIKRWNDGTNFLCPYIELISEKNTATKVYAEIKWILVFKGLKKIVSKNPGRWFIANEDMYQNMAGLQMVNIENNGQPKKIHIARKDMNVNRSGWTIWYRNQDGSEKDISLQGVEAEFFIIARFTSTNGAKAKFKFRLDYDAHNTKFQVYKNAT